MPRRCRRGRDGRKASASKLAGTGWELDGRESPRERGGAKLVADGGYPRRDSKRTTTRWGRGRWLCLGNLERLFGIIGLMEGKPVSIRVNGSWHRIRPVERMLCLGGRAFSLKQVVHRKGGLIIGEGDTGKSTYAGLLAQALEQGGAKPVFVKLRSRPKLELPEVPAGGISRMRKGDHRPNRRTRPQPLSRLGDVASGACRVQHRAIQPSGRRLSPWCVYQRRRAGHRQFRPT